MIRKSFVLASAMALICVTAAQAQKVGTYTGQSADGNFMSMSVTESGGVFSISSANVNFVANCDSGGTASEGWGFFSEYPRTVATHRLRLQMTTTIFSAAFTFPTTTPLRGRSPA
jgi:hypothetical protein